MTPGQQKREAPVDLLSQIGRSVRGTLDAWIGAETMNLVSEVRRVFPAVTTHVEDRGAVLFTPLALTLHPLYHNLRGREPPFSTE